jgi:hypothetical protein
VSAEAYQVRIQALGHPADRVRRVARLERVHVRADVIGGASAGMSSDSLVSAAFATSAVVSVIG